MSRLSVQTDGVTVECDGPVEALDAVQRDAFEVRYAPTAAGEAAFLDVLRELVERARKRAA